jgi:hypothetical protein
VILLAVTRTSSYKGGMDRKAPRPDTVADTANADRACSNDLLVMLGKVLRAISDALDAIVDKRQGSLAARRLISVVLFFIRALLRALRADQHGSRPRSRATATFDRALVAPPSRWAAP